MERREWIPDECAEKCMGCGVGFWLLNRKHHCRMCGSIVCSACGCGRLSNWTGSDRDTLHRVCFKCFDQTVFGAQAVFSEVGATGIIYGRCIAEIDPPLEGAGRSSTAYSCPLCNEFRCGKEKTLSSHMEKCVEKAEGRVGRLLGEVSLGGTESKLCVICYEHLRAGDRASMMDCMCFFHPQCINEWLLHGAGCPLHARSKKEKETRIEQFLNLLWL
ncbi:MAG: uncharacterized protein A8A55_1692 [Amphiamblys sp. WSBS2006]|nr:MAG: uncharacterized protein A8A55_1692 [Amphiamblys sp. WSBS2006]